MELEKQVDQGITGIIVAMKDFSKGEKKTGLFLTDEIGKVVIFKTKEEAIAVLKDNLGMDRKEIEAKIEFINDVLLFEENVENVEEETNEVS